MPCWNVFPLPTFHYYPSRATRTIKRQHNDAPQVHLNKKQMNKEKSSGSKFDKDLCLRRNSLDKGSHYEISQDD
jgi:hypothetical protein